MKEESIALGDEKVIKFSHNMIHKLRKKRENMRRGGNPEH